MNKKILITGANGLLGQKLVYKLINYPGAEVIATSVGENRMVQKSGYTYRQLDIRDYGQVEEAINKFRPDVIINTAAMTNVDACETDREGCRLLNVTAVENIIKACEAFNENGTGNREQSKSTNQQINKSTNHIHLIHLSTDFIFDGKKGPYKEEDEAKPLSYYGESKLASEKAVIGYRGPWAILRTVLVYGVVDNMSRSNIVLWAKDALEKGSEINVVDDQFRTPTLAEDLADGCILAAMKNATGIYNISGKDFMSILELVYRVADFFSLDKSLVKPIKSNTLNQPAKRPPKTGFILDKAVKDLGYCPYSFEEGLKIVAEQLRL